MKLKYCRFSLKEEKGVSLYTPNEMELQLNVTPHYGVFQVPKHLRKACKKALNDHSVMWSNSVLYQFMNGTTFHAGDWSWRGKQMGYVCDVSKEDVIAFLEGYKKACC